MNAEELKPSSGFILPLSIGQSLIEGSVGKLCGQGSLLVAGGGLTYFLFVLICPTWPQLAHFRCVPTTLAGSAPGEVGEPSASADPSARIPFCLSRAIRRSLLRSKRASSFLRL